MVDRWVLGEEAGRGWGAGEVRQRRGTGHPQSDTGEAAPCPSPARQTLRNSLLSDHAQTTGAAKPWGTGALQARPTLAPLGRKWGWGPSSSSSSSSPRPWNLGAAQGDPAPRGSIRSQGRGSQPPRVIAGLKPEPLNQLPGVSDP